MSELKACPFCGTPAEYIEPNDKWVMCPNDGCRVGLFDIAKKTWNTRPIEDALQATIDSLQMRLDIQTELTGDLMEQNRKNLEAKDDLLKRVREAVEEIDMTAASKIFNTMDEMIKSLDEDKRDDCTIGADTLMTILQKHLPELEDK